MRKTVLAAALVLCFSQQGLSQTQEDEFSHHTIFAELGGQGFFYSVNYDYRFTRHFCGRVGFTHFVLEDFLLIDDLAITGFPIMAEYLVGGGDHFLELGAGVIITQATSGFRWFKTSSVWGPVWTTTIGYRYQRANGGFFFRASMPAFFTDTGSGVWGGASFGYTF